MENKNNNVINNGYNKEKNNSINYNINNVNHLVNNINHINVINKQILFKRKF